MDLWQTALSMFYALAMVLAVVLCAGFAMLMERKIAGHIQGGHGPNRLSFRWLEVVPLLGRWIRQLGVVQLLADGLKFFLKDDPMPARTHKLAHFLAPCVALAPVCIAAVMLPFGQYTDATGIVRPLMLCNVDTGVVFVFAMLSLSVPSLILAGFAANDQYSFHGAIRGAAQLVSCGLVLGVSALPVVLATASPGVESPLNLFAIVTEQGAAWNLFTQPAGALLFLTALFLMSNCQTSDTAAASDLGDGYHAGYWSLKAGLFIIGGYAQMLAGGALFILLFLGGWNPPFVPLHTFGGGSATVLLGMALFLAKLFLLLFLFTLLRWTLPRFRHEQMMRIAWSRLLPLSIANFLLYTVLYAAFPK